MEERPRDRADEPRANRGRGGPLSDEGDTAEATRRVPLGGGPEGTGERPPRDDATRRLSPEEAAAERENTTRGDATRQFSRVEDGGDRPVDRREESETRVIRPEGNRDGSGYPRGYFEAVEARETRLREVHGGVDWLASFLGCIFALVSAGILGLTASLVVAAVGVPLQLQGQQLTTAVIVGLVVVGLVLFLAYFFGGYVAGRLARFDGGRNGMVAVLWGVLLTAIIAVVSSLFAGPFFDALQDFVQGTALPSFNSLREAGLVGVGIAVGALLLELLGGFLGGRLGGRYHAKIDRTT